MTKYLLDTNILTDLVKNPAGRARQRIEKVGVEQVAISIIVAAEARFGCAKRQSNRLTRNVEATLAVMNILPVEEPIDQQYSTLRAHLERAGTPISDNDMWIAAHALVLDSTLVTANEREFQRVPGLRIENWLA